MSSPEDDQKPNLKRFQSAPLRLNHVADPFVNSSSSIDVDLDTPVDTKEQIELSLPPMAFDDGPPRYGPPGSDPMHDDPSLSRFVEAALGGPPSGPPGGPPGGPPPLGGPPTGGPPSGPPQSPPPGPPNSRRRSQPRKGKYDHLFPKRDRPVPDFNKVIHVKKIHKKRLVKSSFWKEVISKNYDCMLNIDPKEVEYHICAGKKQVKYEGFWYITKPTKGFDPPEIEIFQVNRNIVDMNGRLEMILFNSRWRQYYLGREFSHAKGTVRDVIVWTDNDRNELVWRRYTNVMALHTVVLKKEKLYLPDRLTSLIQEFLGEKTWRFQRDKEKKDKTVVSRFEAKRVEIVTFMIKLLKLKNMERMREFRADIIKMDDELMLRKWGISDLAAMLPLFPTDAEVAQMRGARVSEKSALIERLFRRLA